MKKLVYGVGVNDADYVTQMFEVDYSGRKPSGGYKQKLVWVCPFYIVWADMLKRCYSDKHHEKRPTYKGCSVDKDWLVFTNFKSWMEKQDYEWKQLDKDILYEGNKVYSPESCVFVSSAVNIFVVECGKSRGECPIGVHWHKSAGKFKAQIRVKGGNQKHLGLFTCQQEAHKAWLAAKLELAYALAAEQTDSRVAEALINRYTHYDSGFEK